MENTLENFIISGARHMAESNGAGWDEAACQRNLRQWVNTILRGGGEITSVSSALWEVSRKDGIWTLTRDYVWANTRDDSRYDIQQYPHH